jgi:NAD/NADP transhydrogenase beta subunit
MESRPVGLLLVGAGALLALVGVVTYYGGLSWFGKLPGDIRYESESAKVFVPITSMIVISILLTLLLNVVRRLF